MSKKGLSEADICGKNIIPELIHAGWDLHKQFTFIDHGAPEVIVDLFRKVHNFEQGARELENELYKSAWA